MLNNNFLRILVSGGIATILQRSLELNPISLQGFLFFMIVFMTISFTWFYLFPNKKIDLSDEEKELLKKQKELNRKIYLDYGKKFFLIVICLITLNIAVNFISFKLGLFDDSFKYRFDTKKAIALNLQNEKLIKEFRIYDENYSLYEKEGKYFLVEEKDNNKHILTLYSNFFISDIFDELKDEENFLDILNNISPTLYKELTIYDFIFKPLWFSNSINNIYWMSEDIEFFKSEYEKYINEKKAKAKEEKYKSLLNKDLENRSEIELFDTLKDLYSMDAFTQNINYVIDIFNELDKRDSSKTKALNIEAYRFAFMIYIQLYKEKEVVNQILQEYDKGVVYSFNFWDLQPDVNIKYSHARFVNLKNDEVTVFWYKNIENIEIVNNELIVNQKDGKKVNLGTFQKQDAEKIKAGLLTLFRDIYLVEDIYMKLK
ncbi:MAG: hypothetical protein PHY66_09325 [Aliarcobacter sp.]|nr:hypothetical protein [Aliarcobacter sp.]